MPTHHACAACGRPLHRLRATPDPHYGLGVVVCPGCRTAVVRRRDPLVQGFRTAWKAARAIETVALQWLVLGLGITAGAMLIRSIARSAASDFGSDPVSLLFEPARLLAPDPGPNLAVLVVTLFLLGLFVGAWTRSALSHLAPAPAWLAWTLPSFGFALLPAGLSVLGRALGPAGTAWGQRGDVALVGPMGGAAVMFGVFVLLGMPLGRPVRELWAAGRRVRWSKRRAMRRRLRNDR